MLPSYVIGFTVTIINVYVRLSHIIKITYLLTYLSLTYLTYSQVV